MNFKEITGTQLVTTLCEIAEPVENITQDIEVVEAFRELANERKSDAVFVKFAGLAYARFIPLLLRKHKADVFSILSAVTGKTVEQIESGSASEMVQDLRNIISSPVLVNFFVSSVNTAAGE